MRKEVGKEKENIRFGCEGKWDQARFWDCRNSIQTRRDKKYTHSTSCASKTGAGAFSECMCIFIRQKGNLFYGKKRQNIFSNSCLVIFYSSSWWSSWSCDRHLKIETKFLLFALYYLLSIFRFLSIKFFRQKIRKKHNQKMETDNWNFCFFIQIRSMRTSDMNLNWSV
jgi:hypothetical protein